MRKALLVALLLTIAAVPVFAEDTVPVEEPGQSATIASAVAGMPAVWHDRVVTQMAVSTRLDSDQDQEGDTSVALAISQTLTDGLLVRGTIAHALQKDVTVGTASIIMKW